MTDLISKVLQGYEVTEHLATGGSSEIYVAKAQELNNASVIIKIAKNDNPKYNADLESLAKKLDVLNHHPNVIDILNTGEHEGRKFLVLEKASMSWKEHHQRISITAKNAEFESLCLAHNTAEILSGLEAAHDEGILHNDITPENILISDVAKLADFFTPEVYADERKEAISSLRSVAEKEVVDARLKYLAPEHKGLINAPVSERSDIYSLGVVLYETMMDSIPIGNYQKIRKKFPEIPKWFEFAVEKAIATNPDERWQSAKEMKEYLEKGLEGKLDEPSFVAKAGKTAWNLAGKVKDAALTAGEYSLWGAGKALKGTGYVASRPLVWGYDGANILIKSINAFPPLILMIGLAGITGALTVIKLTSDTDSTKSLQTSLKNTHGIIAYVNDDEIGFLYPELGIEKDTNKHTLPGTDLVKVRWRNDGKKLLLVDEYNMFNPLEKNPADTALYVLDYPAKKATKILDIKMDSRYGEIKGAYWSKTDKNKAYVQIDHAWYSLDTTIEQQLPLVPENYLKKETSSTDVDGHAQNSSKNGKFVMDINHWLRLGMPEKDGWCRDTGVIAEDAAWYHYDPDEEYAKQSDAVKELQEQSSKPD